MANIVWLTEQNCSLADFKNHVERTTKPDMVPLAASIEANIPCYQASAIKTAEDDKQQLARLMAEWNAVFKSGAGIIAIRGVLADGIVDAVTEVINTIIQQEQQGRQQDSGDHFAPAGSNIRLWNAHEKLCAAAPELFTYYNATPIIPLVSQAWLGPYYQITTQVNIVYPGSKAQTAHRDYHMGFQANSILQQYPAHVHELSAGLTLQGAIAHSDMPLETGPTQLLPYSQTYLPGYLAANLSEFQDYFESHCVQLSLQKGDAMFFNPAVFHAAGANQTQGVQRFANLMQIGSAYGRSIEIVDRARMSRILYPTLLQLRQTRRLSAAELEYVIAACAEGYPFPVNLDLDSPLSGMAPPSQQDLLRQAVHEQWPAQKFEQALAVQTAKKTSKC